MVIRALIFQLSLPGARSLKAKRMVLRSLKDRMIKLNVSVAETDHHDLWNRAEITVAYVSANHAQADSVGEKLDTFVDRVRDVVILSSSRRSF